MEAPSFVSRARTAIHSAAAKAERVFVDFKSNRDSDNFCSSNGNLNQEAHLKNPHEAKQLRWRTQHLGTKLGWQERLKSVRTRMKGFGDSEKVDDPAISALVHDENMCAQNMKINLEGKAMEASPPVAVLETPMNMIPPSSLVQQLAAAAKAGKKFNSVKDLLASYETSSPVRDRAGFSISSVKLLVRDDKEDKLTPRFEEDIRSLFVKEGDFLARRTGIACAVEASLPKDIHGAPPESFIARLSEVIGNFKELQKMLLFWFKVVAEIRSFWSEGKHIPDIPFDEVPDLDSCLLYQQLQVINCCISRKKRRAVATELLDSVIKEFSSNEESAVPINQVCENFPLYARLRTGEHALRMGADGLVGNLTLLETGEAMYSPVTQEGPLLTEDLIKETEELVLRTGSDGAGCCQLLSDMQAFKAANPGCILEDFVRWHSPLDWTESDSSDQEESLVTRGQLSCRMQKEGNLWRELWETAKPVPAVKQTPLFDEDLAVDGILDALEDIDPSELFGQLCISLLGKAFVLAEDTVSGNDCLLKLFYECKHYVVTTCQSSNWRDKVDDLCQAYETMEAIVISPEQVLKALKQTRDTTACEKQPAVGELKQPFMKILLFGAKDRQSQRKNSQSKDQKNSDENHTRQRLSSFFNKKSSLFSKKPLTPKNTWQTNRTPHEPDWTVV